MKKSILILLLCVYACVCEQAHAQKTPIVVFKQESIYILQRTDGSSETIFTKNKDVWHTSSKTMKKVKLLTTKYAKEPGENNAATWRVAFANAPKSLYKVSVNGNICTVIDPKGLAEDFEEFEYNYKGTIGKLPIYLNINGKCPTAGGEDELFTADYIYENVGKKINLLEGKCFFSAKGPSDIEFRESFMGKKGTAIFMIRPIFPDAKDLDAVLYGTWYLNDKYETKNAMQITGKKVAF